MQVNVFQAASNSSLPIGVHRPPPAQRKSGFFNICWATHVEWCYCCCVVAEEAAAASGDCCLVLVVFLVFLAFIVVLVFALVLVLAVVVIVIAIVFFLVSSWCGGGRVEFGTVYSVQ